MNKDESIEAYAKKIGLDIATVERLAREAGMSIPEYIEMRLCLLDINDESSRFVSEKGEFEIK